MPGGFMVCKNQVHKYDSFIKRIMGDVHKDSATFVIEMK